MNADLRTQLRALWNVLDDRGAVVQRQDIEALPDDVVEALCEHEAARIRALIEGDAAGWHSRGPAASPSSTGPGVARSTPEESPNPSEHGLSESDPARVVLIGPAQSRQRTASGLRRCNAGAR